MGRVLKIVVYAIIIVFLYFWLMTIAKSCGSDDPIGSVVDQAENVVDGVADTTDDFFEDEDKDADEGEEDFEDDFEDDFEEEDDDIDYSELDEEIDEDDFEEVASKPVSKPKPAPRKTTTRSSSSGDYLLVAGSYLVYSNAVAMRDRLDRAGFDSEIIQFDGSGYHTVLAGRYNSNGSAQNAASDLSSRGIDNYVHRKQY